MRRGRSQHGSQTSKSVQDKEVWVFLPHPLPAHPHLGPVGLPLLEPEYVFVCHPKGILSLRE